MYKLFCTKGEQVFLLHFNRQCHVCIFKYKSVHHCSISASSSVVSPWTPHTTTRLTPLSRRAILARQTISATGAIVATVPAAKEISYRASCVWHHVTLPRHSVRSGTGGEYEEDGRKFSPAIVRGSSESSAVPVRATFL